MHVTKPINTMPELALAYFELDERQREHFFRDIKASFDELARFPPAARTVVVGALSNFQWRDDSSTDTYINVKNISHDD